jgi:hypothetical protein
MPLIDYPISQAYLPAPVGGALTPLLQVELINGAQAAQALGVVDSGSTITVFSPEFALLLGIEDITSGELQAIGTQGGTVDCYKFDLEMEVHVGEHAKRFSCRIGFFAATKPRNILGRDVLFQHYQLGFNDPAQVFYLRPQTEA